MISDSNIPSPTPDTSSILAKRTSQDATAHEYVHAHAPAQRADIFIVLPAAGEADTLARVLACLISWPERTAREGKRTQGVLLWRDTLYSILYTLYSIPVRTLPV